MQPSSVGSIQESPPELPGKKGKKNICYMQGSVGFKLTHLSEVEVYEVQWLNLLYQTVVLERFVRYMSRLDNFVILCLQN